MGEFHNQQFIYGIARAIDGSTCYCIRFGIYSGFMNKQLAQDPVQHANDAVSV